MLKVKPDNKGFTLVELIITVAIMTLIGVALVGIMTSNTVAFRKTKSDLDVQNVAEDTFNKISNDIMQAKAVYIRTTSGDEYKTKLNTTYITNDDRDLYNLFNSVYTTTGASDFNSLKVDNPSAGASAPKYLFTQLDISELGIGYVLPYDSKYGSASPAPTYDYCIVSYKFNKASGGNPGTIEVEYTYNYMTALNGSNVYTDMLGSSGVIGEVDAINNAIKLTMSFDKNNRKYTSNGTVTIRNSYVLAEPN